MGREIKFRGMNKDTGKFVYGWYTKLVEGIRRFDAILEEKTDGIVRYYIHNSETIGQFTGLHDKNGKEIYEGDIIDCDFPDDDPCAFAVVFEDGGFLKKYNDWDETLSKPSIHKMDIEIMKYKVIGNIHENPELLEVQ